MPNLLFICSKNQWRSPTAETLFKDHPLHQARSAGTSDKAKIKVNQKLLDRADHIFVMERKHKEIIKKRYVLNTTDKPITVLDIEDNYPLDDPEFIVILKYALAEYL